MRRHLLSAIDAELPREVRLEAIEIANALLEEGYHEGKSIRIAIARAKEGERDGTA